MQYFLECVFVNHYCLWKIIEMFVNAIGFLLKGQLHESTARKVTASHFFRSRLYTYLKNLLLYATCSYVGKPKDSTFIPQLKDFQGQGRTHYTAEMNVDLSCSVPLSLWILFCRQKFCRTNSINVTFSR